MNSIIEHDNRIKRKLKKIRTNKENRNEKKSLFTKVKHYYRQRSISLPTPKI